MKYTITEISSSDDLDHKVLLQDGSLLTNKSQRSSSITSSIRSLLTATFLPVNYPDSVTPDYLSYQIWDSIQGLSSYIRGMLTSQALLVGVGVGSEKAQPLSAVMQLVFRDAVGLIGGLVFTALEGSSFDAHAKQWRITADVLNDVSLTLELIAPLYPSFFLLFLSLASACRAVVGVAGAASRTALTQHFAQQQLSNNAADITAKEGAQETAVTLLGMLLGVVLLKIAAIHPLIGWVSFFILTVVHVVANVYALRCLCISRLNPTRMDVLLQHYFITSKERRKKVILTPKEVGLLEPLLPPPLEYMLHRLGIMTSQSTHHNIIMVPSLQRLGKRERACVAECIHSYIALSSSTNNKSNSTTQEYSQGKWYSSFDYDLDYIVVTIQKKAYVFLIEKKKSKLNHSLTPSSLEYRNVAFRGYCAAWMMLHGNILDDIDGGVDEFIKKMEMSEWMLDMSALFQNESVIVVGRGGGEVVEEKNSSKKDK